MTSCPRCQKNRDEGRHPICPACRSRKLPPPMPPTPEMKFCTVCGQKKTRDQFFKAKNKWDGLDWLCKACSKTRTYEWRKTNPERHLEIVAASVARPHVRARIAAYNRTERAIELARRRNSKPGRRKSHDEWLKANPDKSEIYNARRNARRRARLSVIGGRVTAKEWEAVKAKFKHRCAYCGKRKKLTMDHRIPLVKGGAHSIENIVPACLSCNYAKNAKDEIAFA